MGIKVNLSDLVSKFVLKKISLLEALRISKHLQFLIILVSRRSRDGAVGIATGWTIEGLEFESR
jgi:hypothetical protein